MINWDKGKAVTFLLKSLGELFLAMDANSHCLIRFADL